MSTVLTAYLIAFAIVALIILATVSLARDKKKHTSVVSQTAFQDFLPKDKQNAIQIVMEQKESKKLKEQLYGQNE